MPDSPDDTSTGRPLTYEVKSITARAVPAFDPAPDPVPQRATGTPLPTTSPDALVPFTDEELQRATAQQAIQLARTIMFLFRNFKASPLTSGAGLATAAATIAAFFWPDMPHSVGTGIAIGGSIITAILGALARDKAPVSGNAPASNTNQ